MRSLQRSRPDLGLDVPYSVVGFVMRNGDLVLAEGRGLDREGAHTPGHNRSGIAVSFQGNFETRPGPPDSNTILEGLGSWLRRLRQTGGFANLGDSHPPGRDVFGHRDVGQTACPGQHLFNSLNQIHFL
jgi:hypothetical protein